MDLKLYYANEDAKIYNARRSRYYHFVNRTLSRSKPYERANLNAFLSMLKLACEYLHEVDLIDDFQFESIIIPEAIETTESHYDVTFLNWMTLGFHKKYNFQDIVTSLLTYFNKTL